ncbi:MAG: hypothetical protein ABWZ94_06055 [Methyloceanibacter sp.]|jgi:hypothetical protein
MRQAVFVVIGLAIIAMLALIAYQNHRRFHRPLLTTPYQAVMLTNGTMFYGRIDHLGSDHPVLRDVFSVREELDSQTQKQRYVLVRRTDGPNGADHMIFPVTSIVFVEPVRADSAVGRLIEQAGLPR